MSHKTLNTNSDFKHLQLLLAAISQFKEPIHILRNFYPGEDSNTAHSSKALGLIVHQNQLQTKSKLQKLQ